MPNNVNTTCNRNGPQFFVVSECKKVKVIGTDNSEFWLRWSAIHKKGYNINHKKFGIHLAINTITPLINNNIRNPRIERESDFCSDINISEDRIRIWGFYGREEYD